MKTTTLLTVLLTTAFTMVTQGATSFANLDSIVYANNGKEDGTGYYGYLIAANDPSAEFANTGFSIDFMIHGNPPRGASSYTTTLYDGLYAVELSRERAVVPSLLEDYRLDIAAMLICREMFKQDWKGVNFPDGKDLAYFLQEAGWVGDPANVIAITKALPTLNGLLGKNRTAYTYIAKGFPQVLDPAVRTIGYAQGVGIRFLNYFITLPDGAKTSEDQRPDGGRVSGLYYETTLLSFDSVSVRTEAMYDDSKVNALFQNRGSVANTPTKIAGRRGVRLRSNGIVFSPQQLVGRAKLEGHLPKGVHFNGQTGKFAGTPRQAGVRRLSVTATYRLVGGEGATGTHTTNVLIRIRR